MPSYTGITWDHPRGRNALQAAAARLDPARDQLALTWYTQPLEGFESHPIEDLCARYDLVVLDHPHVGEAVRQRCLQPLEDVFSAAEVAGLQSATIGACAGSYRFAGKHWALPLDAAAQMMAVREDLLDGPLPVTWDEVLLRSQCPGAAVVLSLAGPHALLSFLSIASALGEPGVARDPDLVVSRDTGQRALQLMIELASRSPKGLGPANPIRILEYMATSDEVALCPLVFGYVNYTMPTRGTPLRFANAPRASAGSRPGSTLGGTGIGISARCESSPALKSHLLWLMSAEAQQRFIPDHDGQPSLRSAWRNAELNRRWGNFYAATADTLEAACVRPRYAGYIAFQAAASALLREAVDRKESTDRALHRLQVLYQESRPQGGEI